MVPENFPKNFLISQTSLQDFVDCRRLFYLRYIKKLKWPAVQSEPYLENEKFLREGLDFHDAVHQYLIGLPEEDICKINRGSRFSKWWSDFANYRNNQSTFNNPEVTWYPEFNLITTIAGYRLVAKYDLLALHPDGKMIIFDWKTVRKRPDRSWLMSRMQSQVYPILLMGSGQHLSPFEVTPEKITMIYWFANYPNHYEIIEYSDQAFHQDFRSIEDMIEIIDQLFKDEFVDNISMPEERSKCAYCSYRSYCNTGIQAGKLDDNWDDLRDELEFGFEQIGEVPF